MWWIVGILPAACLGLMAPGGSGSGGGSSSSGGRDGNWNGGWGSGGWHGGSSSSGGWTGDGNWSGRGWGDSSWHSGWHDDGSSHAGDWRESSSAAAASPRLGQTAAAGSDGGDREGAVTGLYCIRCKEKYHMQQLLVIGGDWQGQLPLTCFQCSGFSSQSDFDRQVTALWKRRRSEKRREATLHRTGTWKTIVEDVGERHAGESKREFRRRLCEAFFLHASIVATAFQKMRPDQQERIMDAFSEFGANIEKQAANPAYVPPMDDNEAAHTSFWLPHAVTQYIDTLIEGVNEHFVCRRTKCLLFTLSTMWIENGSQYRCPGCGAVYRPWSSDLSGGFYNAATGEDTTGGGVLDAQKILICTTQVPIQELSMPANSCRKYLCRWSDSKTEKIKSRMKEVAADLAQTTKGLPDIDLMKIVRPLVNSGSYSYFAPTPFPQWLADRMEQANATASKPWRFEHVRDGFLSSRASEDLMILREDDSFRMWVLTKYMLQTRVMRPRM
jgi:hypothetical protein